MQTASVSLTRIICDLLCKLMWRRFDYRQYISWKQNKLSPAQVSFVKMHNIVFNKIKKYLQYKYLSFSSWLFVRSVERSYRNLHKFCIFWVRGDYCPNAVHSRHLTKKAAREVSNVILVKTKLTCFWTRELCNCRTWRNSLKTLTDSTRMVQSLIVKTVKSCATSLPLEHCLLHRGFGLAFVKEVCRSVLGQ